MLKKWVMLLGILCILFVVDVVYGQQVPPKSDENLSDVKLEIIEAIHTLRTELSADITKGQNRT